MPPIPIPPLSPSSGKPFLLQNLIFFWQNQQEPTARNQTAKLVQISIHIQNRSHIIFIYYDGLPQVNLEPLLSLSLYLCQGALCSRAQGWAIEKVMETRKSKSFDPSHLSSLQCPISTVSILELHIIFQTYPILICIEKFLYFLYKVCLTVNL